MKSVFVVPIVIILTIVSSTIVPPARSAENPDTSQESLASVNGVSITAAELNLELSRVKKQAAMKRSPIKESNLPQVKAQLLETLINRELLYQESVKKGHVVNAQDIDTAVGEIKARFSGQGGFQKALDDMGVSEATFRKQVERGLSIQKLLEQDVYGKLMVSDKESRSFYDNNPQFFKKPEQVRASHILIKLESGADDTQKAEAKKKIEEIQKMIEDGGDFAELARTHSQGPSSVQGGDLGYFERQKMVKPFSDAAFKLQPGQISPIVETRFGFHIIKVVDRKPETTLAYEEIKERLDKSLMQRKTQEAVAKYIDQLKSSAVIKRVAG